MLDILSIPDEVRRLGQSYAYEILSRQDGRPTRRGRGPLRAQALGRGRAIW